MKEQIIRHIMLDEKFQASCQRYAHGNGTSEAIARSAINAICEYSGAGLALADDHDAAAIRAIGLGPDNAGPDHPRRLTKEETGELWRLAKARESWRAEIMPDEQTAINMLFEAYQRLRELGWKESMYAPRDRSKLRLIEVGSTGIHEGYCEDRPSSKFPLKWFWLYGNDDLWPSSPILFKEAK